MRLKGKRQPMMNRFRFFSFHSVLLCLIVIGLSFDQRYGYVLAQTAHGRLELQQAGNVQMLQSQPGSYLTPFFRIDLNLVDASGAMIAFQLPSSKSNQKECFEITQNASPPYHPFYVSGSGDSDHIAREQMLLVDISGSMLRRLSNSRITRFEAAQMAARHLLDGFQDGADTIAIVAFESRRVKEDIQNARFVNTENEAEQMIQALPRPTSENNTGLYSAVYEAMDLLKARKSQDPARQFQLIVLTDGKNDVNHPLDDPDLLDGEDGLRQVFVKRDQVGVEVYTIGFGEKGELGIDERALRLIASQPPNYSRARDATQLNQVLRKNRRALINRVRITFATDEDDWTRLQTLTFKVRHRFPSGAWVESGNIRWSCPVLTACSPEGFLTVEENRERLDLENPIGPVAFRPWRRLIIFAGFAIFLAIMWFALPRLIWAAPKRLLIKSPKLRPRDKQLPGMTPEPRSIAHPRAMRSEEKGSFPRARKSFEKTVIFKNKIDNSERSK
jgi:hypothetical protein